MPKLKLGKLEIGLLWLLRCAVAFGQVPQELPAFDVASVKPDNAPMDYIETGTAQHGKVTLHNVNIKDCIRYAYGLVSNEQISGPEWTADYSTRFDILATAPPDTPEDVLLLMMQRLLTERFHLALHRELKPIAHVDMEVAKGGLKLPPSPEEPASPRHVLGRAILNYTHTTIQEVAMLLSRQLKQPVLDQTGLKGFYDVKLQWRPDDAPPSVRDANAGSPSIPDSDPRPDLFHAVADLGLKLTASKVPINVLVIDRVDRVPVGN